MLLSSRAGSGPPLFFFFFFFFSEAINTLSLQSLINRSILGMYEFRTYDLNTLMHSELYLQCNVMNTII